MRKLFILAPLLSMLLSSCQKFQENNEDTLEWVWLKTGKTEKSQYRVVHQELFGEGNTIRWLQSMGLYDNKVFCFEAGTECCVFDLNTKVHYQSNPLPEYSHHNNAQFLDIYYQEDDKYPLLLLSRGDYPPNQNECYIVRVEEREEFICFSRIKTIKNTLVEANYGGSWIADTKTGTLYMYSLTKGDWRLRNDNHFCVFSFDLPDVMTSADAILDYSNVKNYWEYSYLIPQGGTFYRGYLFFNVQSISSIGDFSLQSSFNVLAINSLSGEVDAVLPLDETMETEGICVYNDLLYISFKNGGDDQDIDDVVFRLDEYSLPMI